MKIVFLKDHGSFHCGCRAVSSFIRKEVGKVGLTGSWMSPDLVVMNGEGSFHHNYGTRYLNELEKYPMARKVLVNSIWQESNSNIHYLSQFDYINVREKLSQDALKAHGIESKVFLDFSYYAEAKIIPSGRFEDRVVMGDHFLAFDSSSFDYPRLSFLTHPDWSSFLSELSGVRLYITGYHHAVYACCKVRVPFVPFHHNSHKIAGLFDMAGVDIPIPETIDEVRSTIDWALGNIAEYEKLFDFMESYPRWTVDEIVAPNPGNPTNPRMIPSKQ